MAESRVVVTELVSTEWVTVVATELTVFVVEELLVGDIVVVVVIVEVVGASQVISVNSVSFTRH